MKKTSTEVQSPLRVGNVVLIRTVTHYDLGRIAALTRDEVILDDASWVADTGRFGVALETGTLSEVEVSKKCHIVSVSRGAIVDVWDWKHALPTETK